MLGCKHGKPAAFSCQTFYLNTLLQICYFLYPGFHFPFIFGIEKKVVFLCQFLYVVIMKCHVYSTSVASVTLGSRIRCKQYIWHSNKNSSVCFCLSMALKCGSNKYSLPLLWFKLTSRLHLSNDSINKIIASTVQNYVVVFFQEICLLLEARESI